VPNDVDPATTYSPLNLPHLRRLEINGHVNDFSLFSTFSTCPLTTLSLSHFHPHDLPCSYILEDITPLPSSLRSIYLHCTAPVVPSDIFSTTAQLASSNIVFHFHFSPYPRALRITRSRPVARGARAPVKSSVKKTAVVETLEWAQGYVEGLCAVDDEVGMDELAKTLVRVRQLQTWKQQ
jgi:hypothetical protein